MSLTPFNFNTYNTKKPEQIRPVDYARNAHTTRKVATLIAMPRGKAPTLHLHKTGQWYCRWNGKTFYFGKDRGLAERKFYDPEGEHDGALIHWQRLTAHADADDIKRRQARRSAVKVADMVDDYLASLAGKDRADWTLKHNRNHLRRFTNVFGGFWTHELSGDLLEAWGADLRRTPSRKGTLLEPKTIRHDIACVRAMLKWAARRRMVPAEVVLEAQLLEPPRLRALSPTVIPLEKIHAAIHRAAGAEPGGATKLAWSIELLFLTAMRPGELVRLSRGEGTWTAVPPASGLVAPDRSILSLAEHKTVGRTGEMRHIIMCERAVELYDRLHAIRPPHSPRWCDTNAIGKAFRAGRIGFVPKDLRSSAASHLVWAGQREEDADRFLGHKQPGERPTYIREAWPALLDSAARLHARFVSAKPGPS